MSGVLRLFSPAERRRGRPHMRVEHQEVGVPEIHPCSPVCQERGLAKIME